MSRTELPTSSLALIQASRKMARDNEAEAVVMLSTLPYDFAEIRRILKDLRLVVATDKSDVMRAAKDDEVDLVPLLHEPETRQVQLSQALLEAIADELLQGGSRIVALYTLFEREHIDTISLINLAEHLAKLTTRDLRRLETQVPLETLRIVVDLAVEIGREGR
ncbi:MAG: hypothetical protein KDA84_18905, partial [Planctomycetaceae bacterium]|nr:hypothetical protein [Planctomycetaceae bacterium]